MEKESVLARIPLFRGMTPEQRTSVAQIAVEKKFGKNEVIFAEGSEATGFYIVVSGRVKIYKLSPDGKEQILHIFGEGEPFAEAAVFAGTSFPAYAEALEPCEVLFLPRREFVNLMARQPALALNMLAELSRRLRQFANLIENLSLREVPGRLAAYFMILSERQDGADDVLLDMSKTQVASFLGTIPETLSRILARMTREGLIEIGEGRLIRLLDKETLVQLASGERRLT
jgi:CRP/FNR family transcriptional regulator